MLEALLLGPMGPLSRQVRLRRHLLQVWCLHPDHGQPGVYSKTHKSQIPPPPRGPKAKRQAAQAMPDTQGRGKKSSGQNGGIAPTSCNASSTFVGSRSGFWGHIWPSSRLSGATNYARKEGLCTRALPALTRFFSEPAPRHPGPSLLSPLGYKGLKRVPVPC